MVFASSPRTSLNFESHLRLNPVELGHQESIEWRVDLCGSRVGLDLGLAEHGIGLGPIPSALAQSLRPNPPLVPTSWSYLQVGIALFLSTPYILEWFKITYNNIYRSFSHQKKEKRTPSIILNSHSMFARGDVPLLLF